MQRCELEANERGEASLISHGSRADWDKVHCKINISTHSYAKVAPSSESCPPRARLRAARGPCSAHHRPPRLGPPPLAWTRRPARPNAKVKKSRMVQVVNEYEGGSARGRGPRRRRHGLDGETAPGRRTLAETQCQRGTDAVARAFSSQAPPLRVRSVLEEKEGEKERVRPRAAETPRRTDGRPALARLCRDGLARFEA